MKHLLLDRRLIAEQSHVRTKLGPVRKEPCNPLLEEDRPWEVRFDNLYPNVILDDDGRFKVWYNPFIRDEVTETTPLDQRPGRNYVALVGAGGNKREMGVCYAVSTDGVTWDKPDLGIVEFKGSRHNNLVTRAMANVGIARDPRDPQPRRRYKMFGCTGATMDNTAVAFSADGLRWSEPIACPEIGARADTHNVFIYDEGSHKYIAMTRAWERRQRVVARTESDDFIHWTRATNIMRSLADQPHRQTYVLQPFRYAGIYLGFVMILDTRTDLVDCELACSHDTLTWERICPGIPVIPRGPLGTYDSGCIYTSSPPIRMGEDLWIYYGGSDGTHGGWRRGGLALARMGVDRFAGVTADDGALAGSVITHAVPCDGTCLRISADVAAGGSVRVGVVGAEGFGLRNCKPVSTTVTGRSVEWYGQCMANLEGMRVRLCFELKGATLYSFEFV